MFRGCQTQYLDNDIPSTILLSMIFVKSDFNLKTIKNTKIMMLREFF